MKNFDCKTCAVGARQSQTLSGFFKKLSRSGKARSGKATVTSKRMDMARFPTPESTWNYLITFTLEDGSSVELHASEVIYQAITEGEKGLLTWEGEHLLRFETASD